MGAYVSRETMQKDGISSGRACGHLGLMDRDVMAYWVMIFNRRSIDVLDADKILAAITESNFYTLCAQYDLDPAVIDPALANLSIVCTSEMITPIIVVNYQPVEKPPVVVHRWPVQSSMGRTMLEKAKVEVHTDEGKKRLMQAQQILGIELSHAQLRDMGLLLAYELARWAAYEGEGLVRGIDGQWYYLNKHKAFIPFNNGDTERG